MRKCYKSTALDLLRISAKRFDSLGILPVETVCNPHNRSKTSYLYDLSAIENLIGTPEIVAMQALPRTAVDYFSLFEDKYDEPQDAISDAAQGLFSLNRYCKHKSCSLKNREEIYELKGRFIKVLYEKGYCYCVKLQIIPGWKETCRRCDGEGEIFDLDVGFDTVCDVCGGSGKRIIDDRKIYLFSFQVGQQRYSWHTPENKLSFAPVINDTEIIGKYVSETKQIDMAKSKMKEYKELIRWVLYKFEL